ncbi:MAG: energy transducer TonB [Candidatus Acidiferrales bacterium]
MKRILQFVLLASEVLLLAGLLPIWADDQPGDPSVMFARARQLEELRSDTTVPFVLEARLKATSRKKELTGEYKLIWWKPDRWQEVVALADFRRTRDGVSDGYWQARTTEYQPQVIFDLDKVLDVASILQLDPREAIGQAKKRKVAGVELSCAETRVQNHVNKHFCFDPATNFLSHVELPSNGMPGSVRPSVDYSGLVALGEKKFPSRVTIKRDVGFSLEVSVNRLEPTTANPPPVPAAYPNQFEFWPDCREAAREEMAQTVQPDYPGDSRSRREQGVESFYARIEPDGTVSHLTTLQSAWPALERAAREAIRKWKYKPRFCHGTPVRGETIIDVSFYINE